MIAPADVMLAGFEGLTAIGALAFLAAVALVARMMRRSV